MIIFLNKEMIIKDKGYLKLKLLLSSHNFKKDHKLKDILINIHIINIFFIVYLVSLNLIFNMK